MAHGIKLKDEATGAVISTLRNSATSARTYTLPDSDITIGNSLITTNTQTNDYTLVLSDAGLLIYMNKATAINLTVPPNSSVAFPIGTLINVQRLGVGVLTFVQGSGVTITASSGTLLDVGQSLTMTLIKTNTNTWDLQNGAAQSQTKIPTGDVSTTSASATNITGLSWTVDAGATYRISGSVRVGCSTANGIKFGVSYPTATGYVFYFGQTSSGTAFVRAVISSSGVLTNTAFSTAASSSVFSLWDGTLTFSASGTLQIQFGAATGGDTATAYQAGTVIKVEKIS
jgi:hypothetical protein